MTHDKPQPDPRSNYKAFRTVSTRWMDNDAYGHVNNVDYYSWFDTVVKAHLMEHGALDIRETIGLVKGDFIHVYVDRAQRRPSELPPKLKTVLEALQ